MKLKYNKTLHFLTIIVITLTIVSSGLGIFYMDSGESFTTVNQYNQEVQIFGNGIYKHDSAFKAPIFRGTDFAILFVCIPFLLFALILDIRKREFRTRLVLVSILSIFTYIAFSMAFGATYNPLHLIYTALLSCTFFGLIIGIMSMSDCDTIKLSDFVKDRKGINIFLVLSGAALFLAWMPDIINSLINQTTLELIEIYTTEVTYHIDIGIISPTIFICLYLINKKENMGYILLGLMLACCGLIGIIVTFQSIFQVRAGIDLPIQVMITKASTFVVLSMFSFYYFIRLIQDLKSVKTN